MEQGCPHRSILPHIFPDCNSFAIKIGGKFCGVRSVCPGGAACLGVAGAAGVSDTRRGGGRACFVACLPCHCGARGGACLLCRLPTLPLWCPRGACLLCRLLTLPLTCFLAPIPPRPPSRREGGDYRFILPGAAAPGTPALNRLRHLQFPPYRYPAKGCLWLGAKTTEILSFGQCRQPRRGGTGGDGTIRRTRRRRLRWSSPPGQG